MESLLRSRARALAALGLCAGAAHAQATDTAQELFALYYAFEVTAYCSLVDARVGRGFTARERALRARAAFDDETVAGIRGKAWQAANAEWQNRGLGGFRAWCRDDGRRHARELSALAPPLQRDTPR